MADMLRTLAAAAFVLATTATAFAQAPGDVQPGYSTGAPGEVAPIAPATPPGFVCSGAAPINVMADRWSVGLSIGHMAIAPKDAPDNKTEFAVGELSLRFRLTPHLELEGAFGGGRQQLKDGNDGMLEARTGVIAARYRFNPAGHWNWWLMGGLGGVSVAQHGATDQTFKDVQRPLGELGIGIERRFHYFALQAELRGMGIGPRQDQPTAQPAMGTTAPVQTPTMQPPAPMTNTDRLQGGVFTIGASYYF